MQVSAINNSTLNITLCGYNYNFERRLTEEITAEVNSRKPQPRMGRKAQRRLFTVIRQIIDIRLTHHSLNSDVAQKVAEKLTAAKLCGK